MVLRSFEELKGSELKKACERWQAEIDVDLRGGFA